MATDELTKIGDDTLPEMLHELSVASEQLSDSWLPPFLAQAQIEFAQKSTTELAHMLADVAVAVALRIGGSMTPKRVYAEYGERCQIGDESFLEKVAPELRRLIARSKNE